MNDERIKPGEVLEQIEDGSYILWHVDGGLTAADCLDCLFDNCDND